VWAGKFYFINVNLFTFVLVAKFSAIKSVQSTKDYKNPLSRFFQTRNLFVMPSTILIFACRLAVLSDLPHNFP